MINETAMEEGIARSLAGRRFSLILLGTFALLALVLATVGIYGLASYLAIERTQEIGVRIALGAQRRDIVHALLGPVGRVAAIGIASACWPRSASRVWSPECCSTPARRIR